MWVLVAERVSDGYIGILDNRRAALEGEPGAYLVEGAEIPFWPEHVIEIAEPPPEWIAERLGRPPTRHWPRDDEWRSTTARLRATYVGVRLQQPS